MAVRLTKAWQALSAQAVAALPGQLGVFELADDAGRVLYVGVADARSRFGLRSALQARLAAPPTGASQFRVEVNMAYHSRHLELLQVHLADHGTLPPGNDAHAARRLGRLRPD